MKLSIARPDLTTCLQAAKGCVSPIKTDATPLHGVRIEASGQRAVFAASDMEARVERSAEAEITEVGSALVDFEDLYDAVRRLPKNAVVSLETSGTDLLLSCGRSIFRFGLLDETRLPDWQEETMVGSVALMSSFLSRALAGVMPAMAEKDTYPALCGVHLTDHGGSTGPRLVATNSHRLALQDLPGPIADLPPAGLTLPARAAAEIARLAAAGDGIVELAWGNGQATASTETERFTTRLLADGFPDYRRLFAQAPENKLRVARKPLLEAIERVAVAAPDSRAVTLRISRTSLAVLTGTANRSAEEEIDVESQVEAKFAFNADYLIDALKSGTEEEITISHPSEKNRPIFLEGDAGLTRLVMPMAL